MGVYLLPMSYLAAWAKDPAMKKRATMMLEYLIADYAAENLDGLFVGAHSRGYDRESSRSAATSRAISAGSGSGSAIRMNGNYASLLLTRQRLRPPEILKRIATDRSQPYTHYERKRTRNRWRFNDELHGPVYKTTTCARSTPSVPIRAEFCSRSRQHSWDVTWSVPDAARRAQYVLHIASPFVAS